MTRAGPVLIVQSITPQSHPEGVPVYNFEVEDDHTYFVGTANGGTWVHNDCKTIDPTKVRFSQSSIKSTFANDGGLDELAQGLKNGTIDPASISPIRLLERDGQMFTLDNRRLEAFRRAGVKVSYRMATPEEIASEG